MLVNPLELQAVYRPRTLAEALTYLQQRPEPPRILAGGTGLLRGSAPNVPAVLDIGSLGLAYVTVDETHVHVGTATTLQDLVDNEELARVATGIMVNAARAATPKVQRHQQTVGGTLVAGAGNDDLLVAALALDGEVVYYVPEERDTPRVCPLAEFLADVRSKPPFLVTESRFPRYGDDTRGRLERVSRTPRDRAIVNAAAVVTLDGERIVEARVAVGGVGPYPLRLKRVETILRGTSYKEVDISSVEEAAREAVTPVDDWRASAEYRRHLVGVLTRRALQALW